MRLVSSFNKYNKPPLEKELVERLYLKEGKSVSIIAKITKRTPKTIVSYLKKFHIKARPFSTKGLKPRLGAKLSKETKDKIRIKALGRKIPIHIRKKMGSKGKKNPGYIDGRTPINRRIRHSVEYKLWHEAVFQRDNWTCIFCNKRGGELHADHIKPFAYFPELRFAIDNGRTLCIDCHRKTDTYGAKIRFH